MLQLILRWLWALYARVYSRLTQLYPYRQMIDQIIDELELSSIGSPPTRPVRLLDIGCGPGLLLGEIQLRGLSAQLSGIDSSVAMLARARWLVGNGVELTEVDLDEPLDGQGVSGAYSRFCLSHVLYTLKDPAATLARLAAFGAPGAVLVATTPVHGASPLAVFAAHRQMAREQHVPARAARTFLSLLGVFVINLVIIKILGQAGPYHLATEDEVRAWFRDSGWHIDRLERTYGDQDWFIVATRAYPARDGGIA